MTRLSAHCPNPLRLTRVLLPARAGLALALALVAGMGAAQTPDSLPSAPQPRPAPQLALAAPARLLPASTPDGVGSGEPSAEGRGPVEAPVVSMAPHPADGRYWVSGQINIIIQGDLPFHSPYQGPNSFISRGEYKTSLLGTLYTALRPTRSIRYTTDLTLDLESSGGRGQRQALGLAGFTNLDVVRNPTLSSVPYLARYGIHQVIGLTQQTTSQEPGFFAIAPSVRRRKSCSYKQP